MRRVEKSKKLINEEGMGDLKNNKGYSSIIREMRVAIFLKSYISTGINEEGGKI